VGRPSSIPGSARRERAITLLLLFLCQGLQQVGFAAVALFLPRIRDDLALSFTAGGVLAAGSTLIYAFMQIPAGFLSDRFGPRRVFLPGCLGVMVVTLGFGFIATYWHAVALMLANGLFRSLVFAPGMVLVASLFSPSRRATSMGGYIGASFLFTIVLNLVGPNLANALGWRAIFIGVGGAGLLSAVVFSRLAKGGGEGGPTAHVRDIVALARYRVMWLASGIQYARLAIVTGVTFWLPTLLVEEHALSLEHAGFVVALSSAFTAPSNLIGGYVSDRLRKPALVIGGALAVLTVTTASIGTLAMLPLVIVAVCVNAMFMQVYFGSLFSAPIEVIGQRRAGMASGFGNFFANLGSFTFAYVLGAVKDLTGSFQIGFLMLAALAALGVALSLLLARERKAHAARQAATTAASAPAPG